MKSSKELFTKENIVKGLKWFFFSFIWLAILMFVIDIVSKQLIMANFKPGGFEHIWLIPNFLSITYVQNDGMAFGIDTGNKIANIVVFVSVSIIGAIIILGVLIKGWKKQPKWIRAFLMVMLSGTIGNLIDRAFYVTEDGTHFVVDFIHFRFGTYDFPVFNWADSCLVVSMLAILLGLLISEFIEKKNPKPEIVGPNKNPKGPEDPNHNGPSMMQKDIANLKKEIDDEDEKIKDETNKLNEKKNETSN